MYKLRDPFVNSSNSIQRDADQGKWTEEVTDMTVGKKKKRTKYVAGALLAFCLLLKSNQFVIRIINQPNN